MKKLMMILMVGLITVSCDKYNYECDKFNDSATECENLLSELINGDGPTEMYTYDSDGKKGFYSYKGFMYKDSLVKTKEQNYIDFNNCLEQNKNK